MYLFLVNCEQEDDSYKHSKCHDIVTMRSCRNIEVAVRILKARLALLYNWLCRMVEDLCYTANHSHATLPLMLEQPSMAVSKALMIL